MNLQKSVENVRQNLIFCGSLNFDDCITRTSRLAKIRTAFLSSSENNFEFESNDANNSIHPSVQTNTSYFIVQGKKRIHRIGLALRRNFVTIQTRIPCIFPGKEISIYYCFEKTVEIVNSRLRLN